MKSYYDKVQAGQGVGFWGNFAQKLKNIYRQRDNKKGAKKELMALWVNKNLAKKNFVKYAEWYRTLARIVNYSNKVHIDKMKEVVREQPWDRLDNLVGFISSSVPTDPRSPWSIVPFPLVWVSIIVLHSYIW